VRFDICHFSEKRSDIMAEWTQPEEFVNGDVGQPDKDDIRSPALFIDKMTIRGDNRPGVRDRQEEFLPKPRGSYVRCPTCGGRVEMPCRYCYLEGYICPPGAMDKLLADVPRDEARETAGQIRKVFGRARPVS
jgi:hypothetical protein